jgi:hypothetical protein
LPLPQLWPPQPDCAPLPLPPLPDFVSELQPVDCTVANPVTARAERMSARSLFMANPSASHLTVVTEDRGRSAPSRRRSCVGETSENVLQSVPDL